MIEPHFMKIPKIPQKGNDGRDREGRSGKWDTPIGEDRPKVAYKVGMSEAEREYLRQQHWSWIRFIILCAFGGIVVGFFIAGLILRFNFNGLGEMILHSPDRFIYTLLLAGGLGSTCGMIAMGVGIMIRSSLGR